MATPARWCGFISLAMMALFSFFVASTAAPDALSINQPLHGGVLRLVPSFDAKCGCNQTITVTCTPVVLTASIAATNVPGHHMGEPSQGPQPTSPADTIANTLTTISAHDCNGTITTFAVTAPMATALVASPTTHTGSGPPGYSIPIYSNSSLMSDTATSSSKTMPEYSAPTVASSTNTLSSLSSPGVWSTSSFSIASYGAPTQSNNDSTVQSSTVGNMSISSAHATTVAPRPPVPLAPNPNTESLSLHSGASNGTTSSSTVVSIPTDSTITISSPITSPQGSAASTFAGLPSSRSSSTQKLSSTSPGRIPVPLSTTFSRTWTTSTSTSINDFTTESTSVVSAYIGPAFTYYNTTLASTSPTSKQMSTALGHGSTDSILSSGTFVVPSAETLTITHSAHPSSSSLATGTSIPTPAPSCHMTPSAAAGSVHENNVTELAARFCREHFNDGVVFDPNTQPIEDISHPIDDAVYDYSVAWTSAGCPSQLSGQRLPHQKYCEDIYYDNWKSCNDGGWGGVTRIGCLLFDFHPYPYASASSVAPYTTSSSPTWHTTAEPSPTSGPACKSKPSHTNPVAPILPDAVTRIAASLCNSKSYVAGSMFTRQSSPLIYSRPEHGIHYQFDISWTPDTRDQCIRRPEGQALPSTEDCKELLIRDYKECNNGGFGGWIEAGCLRFDFTPSLIFARR